MYIISFSCIIYTYCKLILKSPSGRINKSIVLYESKDEDYFSLVRDVLTRNLNLPQDEVSNMKLCGAHRLGKSNRTKSYLSTNSLPRPIF